MTQPRPTAAELLDAVREFLEDDLLPTLDGRLRFHTRVAVNALDTVGRELRHGPATDDDERQRLDALVGSSIGGHDVETLARTLAEAIRAGTVDPDDPLLLDHLRRTARADVAIANPKWLDEAPPT